MGDAFITTLELFPRGLVYVAMAVAILVIAKLVQDLVTPYKIGEQISQKDNVALALSITGYYAGIVIVFLGALYEPFGSAAVVDGLGFTREYWENVLGVLVYSVIGIAVLNLARILVDRLVLYKFSTEKEIVTDQNAGTGAVEFGVYVAVGLVIAGAISGQAGGPETALAFGALGLLVLVLYTFFYDFTTPYDIHEQIEADNAAVGVALGGNLIAIGIVAFKAVFGGVRELAGKPCRVLHLRGARVRAAVRRQVGGGPGPFPEGQGVRRASGRQEPRRGLHNGRIGDQRKPDTLLRRLGDGPFSTTAAHRSRAFSKSNKSTKISGKGGELWESHRHCRRSSVC